MSEVDRVVSKFGRLADDFVLNVILLKKRDFQNESLPFIQAHALELAAKAAIYRLKNSIQVQNHEIMNILHEIATFVPEISPLFPDEAAFEEYKDLWLTEDKDPVISSIPEPSRIDELELCYFIDNIVNLKYGFSRDLKLVSLLSVSRPTLNQSFKNLFKLLRAQYSDPSTDVVARGLKIFGDSEQNRKVLADVFG